MAQRFSTAITETSGGVSATKQEYPICIGYHMMDIYKVRKVHRFLIYLHNQQISAHSQQMGKFPSFPKGGKDFLRIQNEVKGFRMRGFSKVFQSGLQVLF